MSCLGNKAFIILGEVRGSYIKCDEKTMARTKMDEVRLCIKFGWKEMVNVIVKVCVNGVPFKIFMKEDYSLLKDSVPVRRGLDEDGT